MRNEYEANQALAQRATRPTWTLPAPVRARKAHPIYWPTVATAGALLGFWAWFIWASIPHLLG